MKRERRTAINKLKRISWIEDTERYRFYLSVYDETQTNRRTKWETKRKKTNQHDIIIEAQRNGPIATIVNVKLNMISDGISNCVFAFRNRISTHKTRIVYLLWFWHLFSLFDCDRTIAGNVTYSKPERNKKNNFQIAWMRKTHVVGTTTVATVLEHERERKKAVLGLGHVFICCVNYVCLFRWSLQFWNMNFTFYMVLAFHILLTFYLFSRRKSPEKMCSIFQSNSTHWHFSTVEKRPSLHCSDRISKHHTNSECDKANNCFWIVTLR